MQFFTNTDLSRAIEIMLSAVDLHDPSVMGQMGGLKRRARARAVVAFIQDLTPAPPDQSITAIRYLMRWLFVRAVSNNDLDRLFATAGRKADDRVDMVRFQRWYNRNEKRFAAKADKLVLDLNSEWRELTHQAAIAAGEIRRERTRLAKAGLR